MTGRELTQGAVLAEKYRLVSPLGRGGMGAVWRAEHLTLRSPVAIKLVHGRAAGSPDALARFLQEAQAAAALRSPHVVQIIDYGVHQGTPFIAMELLEGESLSDRLRRVGRLSPMETQRVVTHVARAIARAHEAGVVHRDLKPDNIFLVANADEEVAKVLDFGIAKVREPGGDSVAPATQTGAVMGTPHYMSPEQARGNRTVDHRSDIWSLGVICYECMTGRRPFESGVLGDLLIKICAEPPPPPSSVAPVPAGFDDWFANATARDPDRRFQTATAMVEALRAVVGVEASSATWSAPGSTFGVPAPVSAPVVSVVPAQRSSASVPLLAALSVLMLFVVLGAAAGLLWWTQLEAEPDLAASAAIPAPAEASVAVSSASAAPTEAPAATPGGKATVPAKVAGTSTTAATGTVPPSAAKQVTDAQKKVEAAQASADKARADAEKARKQAEAARKSAEALEALGQ